MPSKFTTYTSPAQPKLTVVGKLITVKKREWTNPTTSEVVNFYSGCLTVDDKGKADVENWVKLNGWDAPVPISSKTSEYNGTEQVNNYLFFDIKHVQSIEKLMDMADSKRNIRIGLRFAGVSEYKNKSNEAIKKINIQSTPEVEEYTQAMAEEDAAKIKARDSKQKLVESIKPTKRKRKVVESETEDEE